MVEIRWFATTSAFAANSRIDNLGSGTYNHIGFFGSTSGVGVAPTEAQDTSWITDSGGVVRNTSVASGQLINNKWVDASGVSVSGGSRVDLTDVQSSGSGTIRIEVSGTSTMEISNAKLYAYNGTNINTDPSGMYVLTYEILGSSASGTGDSQWALTDATNYNYMVDRVSGVGYDPANVFDYIVGVSVRPKSGEASGSRNFGLLFQVDFT
jgi:hypothetical protein